ncbi:MAG TPA: ribosome maturation factor RimM [Rickettsiales bacterium]|nr:ribosome maturation factor RimM [Rickettsiales bacterium]
MTGTSDRLVRLGVISGAHGVRGQVKIRSFTASPEDLTAYGALRDTSGRSYRVRVTGNHNGVLIANIDGVSDRNAAEALRNIELCIPRSALPETDENEYYLEDLAGLAVQDESGAPYGHVLSVQNYGAGDVVEIRQVSGKEIFFPFTQQTFPVIDIAGGRMVIVPPETIAGEADSQE